MASEKELILQAWSLASNETMYWNEMANDKNTEITKQLLAVAALLIPLTGSIVVTQIHLNDALKTTLSGALFFFFASLLCGFIDIYVGARFFRKYTIYNANRAKIYHSLRDETFDQAEERISSLKAPAPFSNPVFSILQITSLSIGILLIIGVIITLLILK